MANTRSAKKMVRKIARRTEVNKARRSRVRTFVRKVEEAIEAGDKSAAQEALRNAQPCAVFSALCNPVQPCARSASTLSLN